MFVLHLDGFDQFTPRCLYIDLLAARIPKDINVIKDAFLSQGATKAEASTDLLANEKLFGFLTRRTIEGKPFYGGTVKFSNSKRKDFIVDFDL